jgi:hypothetical protein
MGKELIGVLTICSGIFSLLATIFKWKVFMNFSRVRGFYEDLGDKKATWLYVVFSVMLILLGVLLLLGVLG